MATEVSGSDLVVGVDGSPDSDVALHWAQRYAGLTGAAVHVVVTWEWPQSYGYAVVFDGYDPAADAQRVADKAVAELGLPADRVRSSLHEGSPGPLLVEESATADLLVVGSRGHSAVPNLLLGSVSTYCVHHSKVPVLVAR